jgi:hypothetical protein
MRTFKVGVFFRVFQVILDEFASETGKQLGCDLKRILQSNVILPYRSH